jgi:hypothetical protein
MMTISDDRRNLPVPDELADVRAMIKKLQDREAELRQMIFADPTARTGANWVAEIRTTIQQRTDLKELRASHPDIVDEFTLPVEITRIVLSGISEDGELIPARRFRKDVVQD